MCGGGRGGVVVGPSSGGTVKRWQVKEVYDSENEHVGDRDRWDPGWNLEPVWVCSGSNKEGATTWGRTGAVR